MAVPIERTYRPLVGGIPAVRLLTHGSMVVNAQNWRSHVHNAFWRLYWNHGDGTEIILPDGPVALPARTPVLIPSRCPGHTRTRVAVRQVYLHFEPQGLPRRLALPLVMTLPNRPAWTEVLDLLPVPPPLPTVLGLRLQALLCEVLAEALAEHPPAEDPTAVRDAQVRIAPALAWIEDHPDERTTLARLASQCGLRRDRFATLFRLAEGVTPMRYALERRMGLAADRLLTTEDTVEHVAQEVGFADRFHFSRAFFSVFHVTPGRFRRG